jgi:CheY-like chemotaxis protein
MQLNGFELIAKIKTKNPKTKIIAMTGEILILRKSLKSAESLGASHTITKPFKPMHLLKAISELLAGDD